MWSLKVVFSALISLLARLQSSPWLCLRTSTLLTYLRSTKAKGQLPSQFKALKCLHYVYLIVLFLRAIALNVYLFKDGIVQDYLTFDPVFTVLTLKYHFFNKYTASIVGLLAIFAAYIDFYVFFLNNRQTTDIFAEITVENVRQCSATDFKSIETFRLPSRRLWKVLGQLHYGKCQITFRKSHLKIFPHLSRKLRIDLVLAVIYSEMTIWAANLITGLIFLVTWALQVMVICTPVTGFILPLAILDLTLLAYSNFNAIRMTFFSMHFNFIHSYLFRWHLRQLQASLIASLGKVAHLLASLRLYQSVRMRIHLFQEYLNAVLTSRVLFVALSTNLLVNVVILNLLLIERTANLEKAFILMITFLQFSLGLYSCQILIAMVAPLYRCESTLYRAQGILTSKGGMPGKGALSVKLGLMTFFELICTKNKFAFTVGTLTRISKKAVFEFLFGYSAFFLYIAKVLRKNQLESE